MENRGANDAVFLSGVFVLEATLISRLDAGAVVVLVDVAEHSLSRCMFIVSSGTSKEQIGLLNTVQKGPQSSMTTRCLPGYFKLCCKLVVHAKDI